MKLILVFSCMLISCLLKGQAREDVSMIVNKRIDNDTDAPIIAMSQGDQPHRKIESVLQLPILFYQVFISPQLKPHCYFHPSCSRFASEAVAQYGLLGVFLGADRIMRCNPMAEYRYPFFEDSKLLFDPVSRYNPKNKSTGIESPD